MSAIEVWLQTGRRFSDILAEKKLIEGKLRRPGATIVLWLKCNHEILDKRLDSRVDAMLEQGLIQEMVTFHEHHNKQRIKDGIPTDYTRGVFQTVGFKEFHDYLAMEEDQRQTEEGKRLLELGLLNMKTRTKRFARRQYKMVLQRFVEHPDREVPPIYELDTTDLSEWDNLVKNKAIEIIESHINGTPIKSTVVAEKKRNHISSNYCDPCKRIIMGDKEYGIHLNSIKHMKVLKRRKLEENK